MKTTAKPWSTIGPAAVLVLAMTFPIMGQDAHTPQTAGTPDGYESYLAHIAAAQASLSLGDGAAAQRWLSGAPAGWRRWEWWYIDAQMDASQRVLLHDAPVTAIAYSPDRRSLATGMSNGRIRIWLLGSGSLLKTFQGHESEVRCLSFRSDGAKLASCSADDTIRIWDVQSGREEWKTEVLIDQVFAVAYGYDQDLLASAHRGIARLWDVEHRVERAALVGHQADRPVTAVTFRPGTEQVATASTDGTVRIWDVSTGAEVRTVRPEPTPPGRVALTSVDFTTDGQVLAAGATDGTVWVWDVETGHPREHFEGHDKAVVSVAFGRFGDVVSGSKDGTIRTWNINAERKPRVLMGHRSTIRSVAVSVNGKQIASASTDGTARIWPMADKLPPARFHCPNRQAQALRISPDERRIALACGDGSVRVWNLASGQLLAMLQGHSGVASHIAFSPQSDRLASSGTDGTIRVWDMDTGKLLRTVPVQTPHSPAAPVAFSPDGALLCSASAGEIRLWDTDGFGEPIKLEGHKGLIQAVTFSPEGTTLATGGRDHAILLWNVATRTRQRELTGHTAAITGLSFHPREQRLASSSDDGTIRLWDVHGESPPTVLRGHHEPVKGVAFHPTGQRLASFADDETARLWDPVTGNPVIEWPIRGGGILAMSFAGKGRRLAVGSADGTAYIFDTLSLRARSAEHTRALAVAVDADVRLGAMLDQNMSLDTASNMMRTSRAIREEVRHAVLDAILRRSAGIDAP